MRALVHDEALKLADIPEPKPERGEALVQVLLAGICRTDIEITAGYMDFRGVLGHEFVGRVLECDSQPDLAGKRVAGEINIAPWEPEHLARRHDPKRSVLGILGKDGCFAERITLPAENLVTIPDGISDRAAVFVEPLAAACEILEQIRVRPTDRVAVLGDGKLGLLCAQVVALPGCEVTLFGRHEKKLAIAKNWGGIGTLLADAIEDDHHKSFDIVVDCTGRPEGLQNALCLVRPRGTLVLKTTTAAPPDFHTAPIVIDEITIVGSRCGPFAPAVRLLESGRIDVEALIDAEYPLAEALTAFEHAQRKGALKTLLNIHS